MYGTCTPCLGLSPNPSPEQRYLRYHETCAAFYWSHIYPTPTTTLMPHASDPWNRKMWDPFSDLCCPTVAPMQRVIAPHVHGRVPSICASS